jgi:hypothetical protein
MHLLLTALRASLNEDVSAFSVATLAKKLMHAFKCTVLYRSANSLVTGRHVVMVRIRR